MKKKGFFTLFCAVLFFIFTLCSFVFLEKLSYSERLCALLVQREVLCRYAESIFWHDASTQFKSGVLTVVVNNSPFMCYRDYSVHGDGLIRAVIRMIKKDNVCLTITARINNDDRYGTTIIEWLVT